MKRCQYILSLENAKDCINENIKKSVLGGQSGKIQMHIQRIVLRIGGIHNFKHLLFLQKF